MSAIGPAAGQVMKAAASRGLERVRSLLRQLPPPNWNSEQVSSQPGGGCQVAWAEMGMGLRRSRWLCG
jgi:hypothetical protein